MSAYSYCIEVHPFARNLVSVRVVRTSVPRTGFIHRENLAHSYVNNEHLEETVLDAVDLMIARMNTDAYQEELEPHGWEEYPRVD